MDENQRRWKCALGSENLELDKILKEYLYMPNANNSNAITVFPPGLTKASRGN